MWQTDDMQVIYFANNRILLAVNHVESKSELFVVVFLNAYGIYTLIMIHCISYSLY